MFRKRISILVACATLGTAAALSLGPAASSAPGDNAVVHWSGVAEAAIWPTPSGTPRRRPAARAGGMVHGAMYDAVAAVEGGLEPFATGVTAAPGASADAAVAQAARDVLVVRVPGPGGRRPDGVRRLHGGDSGRACEGRREGGGAAAAAGMLAMRVGGPLRRRRAVRPADARAGRVRADRADYAGRPEARPRAAVHVRLAVAVPARARVRAQERALREGPGGTEGVRRASTAPSRTAAQTETVRFHTEPTYFQFSRACATSPTSGGSTCGSRRGCSGYERGSRRRTR